jgi:NAD(P)H-hydrate epimerase
MELSLSRDQCREVDRRAIQEYGMSGLVLMENAGRGCADVLCELGVRGRIVILCGKGNNGGDGFVLARHLEIRRVDTCVLLLARRGELSGDAAANFNVLRHTNVPIHELKDGREDGIAEWLAQLGRGADWLVDAMLGTGATGPPRVPIDAAIRWFNEQPARKLAVDVPSGLDCDTGEPAATAVRADITCTFVAQKLGYKNADAAKYTGEIRVLDIGAPRKLVEEVARGVIGH